MGSREGPRVWWQLLSLSTSISKIRAAIVDSPLHNWVRITIRVRAAENAQKGEENERGGDD